MQGTKEVFAVRMEQENAEYICRLAKKHNAEIKFSAIGVIPSGLKAYCSFNDKNHKEQFIADIAECNIF